MKKLHLFQLIILVIVISINANCKKKPAFDNATGIVVSPPQINTAPITNAGSDMQLILPANTFFLFGSAFDKENNIQLVLWNKISGPSSFLIEDPNSFSTPVRNLELGVYQFELTVKDSAGLMSKDTVVVTVGQISTTPNEKFFNNLSWSREGLYGPLLWGSAIIITNIYQYLPPGSVFRTFLKKRSSANWEELFLGEHSWYALYLVNGTLILWSTHDETEPVDIKLVY